MKKPDLNKLLYFIDFLHKFQKVQRQILIRSEDRQENDLEHSGQLAIFGWYVIDSLQLELDSNLVLKYCLAHDIVETYAGDVFFYDTKNRKDKNEKEEKARLRIKSEFPEFADMHDAIEDYEHLVNDESKFVYALDKIVPILNIYLDNGRSWKMDKVNLKMLKDYKQEKVKTDKIVNDYFEQIIALLQKHEEELF